MHGIVRTVEWALPVPLDEAERRLSDALSAQGFQLETAGVVIRGKSKRALVKNRWAAEIAIELAADGAEFTRAICRVDMLGSKHYVVLDEIAEAVGDEAFDDRGLNGAVERLGKAGRLSGVRRCGTFDIWFVRTSVLALGQGSYRGSRASSL